MLWRRYPRGSGVHSGIQPYSEGLVAPLLVAGANQMPANLTNSTPTTYASHVRSYIQLAATRLSIIVHLRFEADSAHAILSSADVRFRSGSGASLLAISNPKAGAAETRHQPISFCAVDCSVIKNA